MKHSKGLSTIVKIFIYSCFTLNIIILLLPFVDIILPSFTKELSPLEITNNLQREGCILNQNKEKIENSTVEVYTNKVSKKCPYTIKYTIIDDANIRDTLYTNLSYEIDNNKNKRETWNVEKIDYYSYSSKGDNYKIVVMHKKSILYIDAKVINQDKVTNILNNLGYNDKKHENLYKTIQKIVSIYTILVLIICWYKINNKIGRKWWVMFIPIYNVLCLSEDILGNKLYCLLLLTPFSFLFFVIFLFYNLAKVFGLDENKRILTIFLFSLYIPIIAFGNFQYIKPTNKQKLSAK